MNCGYPAAVGGDFCEFCAGRAPAKRPAGFGTGAGALFAGFSFLLKTPRTKRYAAAPVAIAGVIFTIAAFALWNVSEPLRHAAGGAAWIPDFAKAIITFLLGIVFFTIFIITVWFTAAPVTAVLAAPFLDIIVGRVDEAASGRARALPGSFWKNIIFAVGQSVPIVALIVSLNLAAIAVAWIPPAGPFVSFILLSFGAGLGALDIATARRGFTISQKLRVLKMNTGAVLGLGTALVFLAFIPLVGWMLTIPLAAAGGGLLMYQLRMK